MSFILCLFLLQPNAALGGESQSNILVNSNSNIEFVVTDPSGKKVGYDPISKKKFTEVRKAEYYTESVPNEDPESDSPDLPPTKILQHSVNVLEGTYKVDIYPISVGPFNLSVLTYDKNGNQNNGTSKEGLGKVGEKISFSFVYSNRPRPAKAVEGK